MRYYILMINNVIAPFEKGVHIFPSTHYAQTLTYLLTYLLYGAESFLRS